MTARAERRAIAALLAVFALLVQVLTPVAALANSNVAGGEVICTAAGAVHGAGSSAGHPAPAGRHDGAGCDHCVCPVAAASPPGASADPRPVRYALGAAPVRATHEGLAPGRGLAAPPPPSRGPPPLTI
jgi:hypothetical protein